MDWGLTLNNGSELANSYALLVGTDLFLYIQNGYGIKDVFDLLIVPENTEQIIYTQNNGESVTYNGYTQLIAVRDEGNGLITAILRGE